jgi:glycine betaine/choline ABC-type transport system substrate-binding protein
MSDEIRGLPAFELYYGGEFEDTATIEDADLAAAITDGDADCFVMNSLNPLITTERMTILTDDQLMVPTNAALALMASTTATPEAIGTIDAIASALTTERLNQMLNQIINNGGDPVVVANAFVDTL